MINNLKKNNQLRQRRKKRVRAKIFGTDSQPRLSVFVSNQHLYTQLINDEKGITLVSASDLEIKEKGKKVEIAKAVGKLLAEKALKKNIKEAVFDRGSSRYHGRVRAVAEGARQASLKI